MSDGWDKATGAAVRTAVHVRGVEPEHVVLSMVRRIVRATDLDDGQKIHQINRVIAALERIYAEVSE